MRRAVFFARIETLNVSSIPVLLQIGQRDFTLFMRVVDANRNELLAPEWEAESSTSKRGAREDSLYRVVRQFRSREALVSTTGAFARIRLYRSFDVFLAADSRRAAFF